MSDRKRKSTVFLCAALSAVVTVGLTAAAARQRKGTEALPRELAVADPAKAERALLKFDRKDLPGRYYFGDGLGVNCSLDLKEDGTFKFSWHGCLGEYDRNNGTWKLDGDLVLLAPEQANRHEGFEGVNVRFVPVKQGARVYLVDEFEMPAFCASTARGARSGLDDLHGHDFVKRTDDGVAPADGKPVIPDRFREYYEHGPVEAKVLRIDRNGNAVLNKGRADRLRPGMLLATRTWDNIELRVLAVSEHSATARPFYFWNSDDKVSSGVVYTTGEMYFRPHGTGFPRFATPQSNLARKRQD